jgi:hypothetical protein
MVFHNPRERKTIEIATGFHARTFWGNKLMLVVVDIDARAFLPNHSHPHEQGGIESRVSWNSPSVEISSCSEQGMYI